jgi:hypothetical protein
MQDGDRVLTIEMETTTPEAMEKAAEIVSTRLNGQSSLTQPDAVWRIDETLTNVEFREVLRGRRDQFT